MDDKTQIGRLAFRHEGSMWNAYYAEAESMDGAKLLGSIAINLVARPERKEAFMSLMREVFADFIEEAIGVRPDWGGPQRAPEHERSGHA
jgi:hypothetical protein